MAAAKNMPDKKGGSHLPSSIARKWLRNAERPLAKSEHQICLKVWRGGPADKLSVSLAGYGGLCLRKVF